MRIKNKQESLNFMKREKLNHFGEEYFEKNDFTGVTNFLNEYPVKYYFLHELMPASPKVFYNLSRNEVLEKCRLYDKFGLDVSSTNYYHNRILCGEIILDEKGTLLFSGSTNKDSTHRNFKEPNYFIKSTIFDKKLKFIPTLDKMIDYIFEHNLFNLIIEFCTFDIPVGIYNEKIIIYEVRTNY